MKKNMKCFQWDDSEPLHELDEGRTEDLKEIFLEKKCFWTFKSDRAWKYLDAMNVSQKFLCAEEKLSQTHQSLSICISLSLILATWLKESRHSFVKDSIHHLNTMSSIQIGANLAVPHIWTNNSWSPTQNHILGRYNFIPASKIFFHWGKDLEETLLYSRNRLCFPYQ